MRDNQCHTLLTFWYERQVAGHSPVFRFSNYLVEDQLVEGHPRELVKADDDEREDLGTNKKPKGKSGVKRRRVRSAKGKEKACSSDESSDASSTEDQSTEVGSDITPTNDADDRLDDLDLHLLHDDMIQNSLKSRPFTPPLSTTQPPTSAPTAILPVTPERPAFEELEDFTVEPLEVSSLQPELQTIANSLTTTASPAVRKLLITAFQALQVDSASRSGSIADKASLVPERHDPHETKRSRSDSLDPISSSPTKKSRLLPSDSDSMSSEGKGIEYRVSSNKRGHLDLIPNGEKTDLEEGSSGYVHKGKPRGKKNGAKVVPPTEVSRRTRSQVVSDKMATRASSNRRK